MKKFIQASYQKKKTTKISKTDEKINALFLEND